MEMNKPNVAIKNKEAWKTFIFILKINEQFSVQEDPDNNF
jgi:hypothetical protein